MNTRIILLSAALLLACHREPNTSPPPALEAPPGAAPAETVVRVSAKKFEFSPNVINLKRGVPMIFEVVSTDRLHGFNIPDFKVRMDVKPGEVNRLRWVPPQSGQFVFRCDVFCGGGHEEMSGELVVTD